MIVVEILAGVFLVGGALFLLATAVGVLRFPDFYTRLHAAGKGDTLGQALVVLGLVLTAVAVGESWVVVFKLLLIVFFVFLFNPTATHALARGAWVAGVKPWLPSGDAAASAGAETPPEGGVAPVDGGAATPEAEDAP